MVQRLTRSNPQIATEPAGDSARWLRRRRRGPSSLSKSPSDVLAWARWWAKT